MKLLRRKKKLERLVLKLFTLDFIALPYLNTGQQVTQRLDKIVDFIVFIC